MTQINGVTPVTRYGTFMIPYVETLFALCATIPPKGGLIFGLLLAGLAGSPLHCGPMCGGFVLGQVADQMTAIPAGRMCEWRRISAGALLPYHAGRIVTYAALGGVAGLGGSYLGRLPWVPTVLLGVASALFAALAWRRWFTPATTTRSAFRPRGLQPTRNTGPTARLALTRFVPRVRNLPLGLLLGFLPCGFLYAALTAAAASQDPVTAVLGMAAFGLGTAPALVGIGIVGQAAGQRWRATLESITPFILVANAALLALLAIRGLAWVDPA